MYDDDAEKYPYSTLYLLENLFQGSYEEKPEEYKKGSPYYYIDSAKKTPLLLVQDEQDDVVPFSQAQAMFDRFSELNIPCELVALQGVRHQIDFRGLSNPSISEALDKILEFIEKYK
jgi:dipeptidyl aminopeptidase/acylaminoacyl peptidase